MNSRSLVSEVVTEYLERFNTSGRARYVLQALLLSLASVLTIILVDRNFAYSFEPDSASTVSFVQLFSRALETWQLPAPGAYPPYFDGQFIIYAAVALILKFFRTIGVISTTVLPTGASVAICAIRCTNAAARVLATMCVFSTASLLARSNVIAFVSGLLFLLSPQMLEIDLSRIDHLIALLFAALIYECVKLLQRGPTSATCALIGVLAGALATTKITGLVFAVVPVIALVLSARSGGLRQVFWVGLVFIGTVALLSFRYLAFEWLHPGSLYSVTSAKFSGVKEWYALIPVTPYLFYSYQHLLPYGVLFIILSWGSVLALLSTWRFSDRSALLIALSLLVFALLGIPILKYPRGGYHLVLLHILVIAAAAPGLQRVLRNRFSTSLSWAPLALAAALVPALVTAIGLYVSDWNQAKNLRASITATRLVPREWFREHIPRGSRVVSIIHSDWTTPPLDGLGYARSNGFLTFPYLDKEKMTSYLPPQPEEVTATTDVILLSDVSVEMMTSVAGHLGLASVAAQWRQFFESLKTQYPYVVFEAGSPNYGVRAIEVYVVNRKLAAELLGRGVLSNVQ